MNKIDLIIDALERANELWLTEPMGEKAIAAAYELKAELAKPEQEPVGQFVGGIPEVSQQREWVGLTDEEIKNIMQRWRNGYIDIKDVEQLLKEKNT